MYWQTTRYYRKAHTMHAPVELIQKGMNKLYEENGEKVKEKLLELMSKKRKLSAKGMKRILSQMDRALIELEAGDY